MKQILIILRRLQHGGIEKATINLANALATQGHQVHIWVLRGQAMQMPNSSVIVHAGGDLERAARKGLSGALLHLLNRTLLRFIFPGSGFIWNGWLSSRRAKQQVATWEKEFGHFDQIIIRGQGAFELLWNWQDSRLWQVVEGSMMKLHSYRWKRWFCRLLFQNKQVVCVSHGIASMLSGLLQATDVKPAKVCVIHNGLPMADIKRLANTPLPVMPSAPYLVHVSRLVPVKNQKMLLEAFKLAGLSCQLVIVGDGSERASLEQKVAELGLTDRVIFAGHQDNPYPWMAGAEAFVLSSRSEGLGMVLIESLVCGTQVIATDVPGGIREILTGEQMRLLSAPNAEALADKMREAMSHPVPVDETLLARFDDMAMAQRFVELQAP